MRNKKLNVPVLWRAIPRWHRTDWPSSRLFIEVLSYFFPSHLAIVCGGGGGIRCYLDSRQRLGEQINQMAVGEETKDRKYNVGPKSERCILHHTVLVQANRRNGRAGIKLLIFMSKWLACLPFYQRWWPWQWLNWMDSWSSWRALQFWWRSGA